jgi:hypothetical protein
MIHPHALKKLFEYNGELITKQSALLSDAETLLQLPFEGNCFNWVLGHIISSRSSALVLVGEQAVWTDEQRARYRHGSAPIYEEEPGVLTLSELVQAFAVTQTRLLEGLDTMTYDVMCQASGYRQNTIGDSLGYFHFHETHHVGQLLYLAQYAGKNGVWLA